MKWDFSEQGHHTVLAEIGPDTLIGQCITCDKVVVEVDKHRYPKYRIAWQIVTAALSQHALDNPLPQ